MQGDPIPTPTPSADPVRGEFGFAARRGDRIRRSTGENNLGVSIVVQQLLRGYSDIQ